MARRSGTSPTSAGTGLRRGRSGARRDLVGDVVLVEADVALADVERAHPPPGGSLRSSGTMTSITNAPPGARWAATFRKQATWAAWAVRFMIVLNTR